MSHTDSSSAQTDVPGAPLWGAIFSLAFSIAVLLITELLPVSVLTPMASSLDISPGLAGQSLTATALVAIFSSLLFPRLTRGLDRRHVVLALSIIMVISNLLVALAPDFFVLLLARLFLGVALGAFWAMAPAVTMRLAPETMVSRALSIIFGGVSVALVIAAPLGSYLGSWIGWRGVFGGAAALGLLCGLWQAAALPRLPSDRFTRIGDIWAVARRPGVGVVLLAMLCVFGGQFTFFSYMRPFYEQFVGLGVETMSGVFLVFGVANFIGTSVSSPLLNNNLKATLAVSPCLIGLSAFALALFGMNIWVATALTAVWGFVFGTVPVGWSTWITRNLPDEAEHAGGLQVAVIQLANTLGAAIGGYLLDMGSATTPVFAAGGLMLAAALTVGARVRTR